MGDADIFGLGAVDDMAEDPASGRAMRVHAATAVFAFSARRDAGDQNPVAGLEGCDPGSDRFDDADAFVAQNAARCTGRHVTFQDMKVGPADGCLHDLHDRIARGLDLRPGPVLQRRLAGTAVNECLHGKSASSAGRMQAARTLQQVSRPSAPSTALTLIQITV